MELLNSNFLQRFVGGTVKQDLGADYEALKAHVLARLNAVPVGTEPFYHCWIDQIFPDTFYDRLHTHMLAQKTEGRMQPRLQDNPEFTNRRFNLIGSQDEVIAQFHALWSDQEVKAAAFRKFYLDSCIKDLARDAVIHEEFEYTFSLPARFQNIHVDIPPKVLSFVFYLPDGQVDEETEKKNATILYDKELVPRYSARFRRNSVCLFAAHYYSYHGFSSTIERDALVMFLVVPSEMERWRRLRTNEDKPFDGILTAISEKMQRYPLLEYGTDPAIRDAERNACRINAPKGRVLVD